MHDDGPMSDLAVRPLVPADRPRWDVLWDGYLTFYAMDLDPAVTERTWRRFFSVDEPMHAIGAVRDDTLVGICHYLFHRSTWSATMYCYLEDLFTDPDHRGRGVGRALIEATAAAARRAGADRLYWQTHRSNTAGRSLYDQVAEDLGFIVYERRP